MAYFVFDIGGSKMRFGVSGDGNTILHYDIFSTPKMFGDAVLSMTQFLDKNVARGNLKGVAGGIAGPLNREKSILVNAPNLLLWTNLPIRDILNDTLKVPVFLENDTALIGLGEATKGAGVGNNIIAYLGIGTGVGGVRIVGGKIDESSMGFEPGHQVIDASSDLSCGCSGKGHLEAFVGGSSLEKQYGKNAVEIENPQVFEDAAKMLAIGINNTIVHWSPDCVVLGGSMMKRIPTDRVEYHLRNIVTIFPNLPEIKSSTLGDLGGLYGALKLLS